MLLDIKDLTVTLPGTDSRRPVLDEVSLTVAPGEVVGLVGESGSGKSTTARAALRLLPGGAAVSGRIGVGGTDVLSAGPAELTELRSRRVSMVFQDPRSVLNPVRRVGDFLTERLVLALGTPKAEARARALDLLAEVGLDRPGERFRQYPHEMSGGMLQRVVLAAALTTGPELLLADEATSALDATTQAEVLSVLRDLRESRGMGVLFITHDLHLAAAYCHRVHVMYAGRVVESREASALFADPRHPYTRGLIACNPGLGSDRAPEPIPGSPPSLSTAFTGCPFVSRCPDAQEACTTWRPETFALADGGVACLRADAGPGGGRACDGEAGPGDTGTNGAGAPRRDEETR